MTTAYKLLPLHAQLLSDEEEEDLEEVLEEDLDLDSKEEELDPAIEE